MNELNRMKEAKLIPLAALALLLGACGARDDKNKHENYPTLDTTEKQGNMNDPKNPGAINGEGDMRHNIEE